MSDCRGWQRKPTLTKQQLPQQPGLQFRLWSEGRGSDIPQQAVHQLPRLGMCLKGKGRQVAGATRPSTARCVKNAPIFGSTGYGSACDPIR
jgi:hypothetical protein